MKLGRELNIEIAPVSLKSFFDGIKEAPICDFWPRMGRYEADGTVSVKENGDRVRITPDTIADGVNWLEPVFVRYVGVSLPERGLK